MDRRSVRWTRSRFARPFVMLSLWTFAPFVSVVSSHRAVQIRRNMSDRSFGKNHRMRTSLCRTKSLVSACPNERMPRYSTLAFVHWPLIPSVLYRVHYRQEFHSFWPKTLAHSCQRTSPCVTLSSPLLVDRRTRWLAQRISVGSRMALSLMSGGHRSMLVSSLMEDHDKSWRWVHCLHAGFFSSNEFIQNVRLVDDIRVNVGVPDVISLPLGGGTVIHINELDGSIQVGPDSVGYRLDQDALAFGGQTITGTDIALAAGLASGVSLRILHVTKSHFDTDWPLSCQPCAGNHQACTRSCQSNGGTEYRSDENESRAHSCHLMRWWLDPDRCQSIFLWCHTGNRPH